MKQLARCLYCMLAVAWTAACGTSADENPCANNRSGWRVITPPAELRSSRQYHSVIWTGGELLVWGGLWELRSAGLRVDLRSGSVRQLGGTNAPLPSPYHDAAWTGSEMLIWGGIVSDDPLAPATGARYSVLAGDWQPMSSAGGAPLRALHSVWTGAEWLFLVGDWMKHEPLRVYAYDPSLDSWKALPSTNAPRARSGAEVIWTGSELLLWGGEEMPSFDRVEAQATGARYGVATGAWTPMSTIDAPSPRGGHTIVWTGTEAVVWGGGTDVQDKAPTGSGARYFPSEDRWEPITVHGAPSTRTDHAAVFSGRLMLVWGGSASRTQLSDGGAYDVEQDRWYPLPTSCQPPSLDRYSTTLANDSLVIWGGALREGSDLKPSPEQGWVLSESVIEG